MRFLFKKFFNKSTKSKRDVSSCIIVKDYEGDTKNKKSLKIDDSECDFSGISKVIDDYCKNSQRMIDMYYDSVRARKDKCQY